MKKIQVSEISSDEKRVLTIARRAYDDALEFFFFPSIPDPELIFDYTQKIGFFIDFSNYKITLNLANAPEVFLEREYYNYFFSLSLHEISHYVICPFDNYTNIKLLSAVLRAKVYKYYAPIIVNIFSDLIIDYKNHLRFPEIMEWEMKIHTSSETNKKDRTNNSRLWKILCRSYEIMWQKKFLNLSPLSEKLDDIAQKVSHLVKLSIDQESNWEKNIKKIAKIILPILKEECQIKDEAQMNQQMGTNPLQIPEDVSEQFGNLNQTLDFDRVKNGEFPDKTSSNPNSPDRIKNDLENSAQMESFGTFQAISNLYGFHDTKENLAMWYRGQGKNLIKIEIFEQKEGGSLPIYPTKWRLGDPVEELDPIQTLINSPVIIPNFTTMKWVYEKGPGINIIQKLPDLMIVLDSSGSMTWNFTRDTISGKYHISLLASFAALYYALQQGSYVSVLNFSENCYYSDWTNDFVKLEECLLHYQGSGTILPSQQMLKLSRNASRPSCILIITDFEIHNWDQAYNDFISLLTLGNKIICFFIGGNENQLETDEFENLRNLGASFFCIKKRRDLIGLVIREIKNIYQGSSVDPL